MILFLGTRPGKTRTRSLSSVPCPYCDQKGTLTYSRTPNYFHLFWLPLFTVQTWEQVSCSHCKRVYDREEFPASIHRELEE